MALSLGDAIAKVKHYFAHEWKGGLVHSTQVGKIINGEWELCVAVMESIVAVSPDFTQTIRHTCPEMHSCEADGYCDECGYQYPMSSVRVDRYISPSPESGIKPKVFGDSEAPKYLEAIRSVVPDMGALTAYAIAEAVIKASRE